MSEHECQCDDSVTLRMQLDTAVKAHAGQKAVRALVEKERDRLRVRMAELEAAGSVAPDDAHTTAGDTGSRLLELAHRLDDLNLDTDVDEIVTELRKIGAGLLPPLNRSRTVSTTTRTTDWKADER